MNSILPISTFSVDESHLIGIIITKIDSHQFHCGLAYKYDGSKSNVLHLAWHYSLEFEIDDKDEYFWIASKIHPVRQRTISAKCFMIRKYGNTSHIPYSIKYSDTTFDNEGVLKLGKEEHGLTCATFILAVFKSCGIDLINTEQWPTREEDLQWQEKVISVLEGNRKRWNITREHIENVRNEKGCARFRPEEVAASSLFKPVPATFHEITKVALSLREKLNR